MASQTTASRTSAYPPNPDSWFYGENGVPKLSTVQIAGIATGLLNKYAPECLREPRAIPINTILEGVQAETRLIVHMAEFEKDSEVDRRGVTIFSQGTIIIDRTLLLQEDRNPYVRFTIAHELGHWLLQRHRPIYPHENGPAADRFVDDVSRLARVKRTLETTEDWVEWQANCFASHLILPRRPLLVALVQANIEAGVSRARLGEIFINSSPQGKKEAHHRIALIAERLGVSGRQVMNALESEERLKRQEPEEGFGELRFGSATLFPGEQY